MSTETTRLKLSEMEDWKRKAALYDAWQGERAEVIVALERLVAARKKLHERGNHLQQWLDALDSTLAPLHAKLTATPEPTVASHATTRGELTYCDHSGTCSAPAGTTSTTASCEYCGKELHYRDGKWWTWDAADYPGGGRPQNGPQLSVATPEPEQPLTVAEPSAEPSDTTMLDWLAVYGNGNVRGTDYRMWTVQANQEGDEGLDWGASLRKAIRAAMKGAE